MLREADVTFSGDKSFSLWPKPRETDSSEIYNRPLSTLLTCRCSSMDRITRDHGTSDADPSDFVIALPLNGGSIFERPCGIYHSSRCRERIISPVSARD